MGLGFAGALQGRELLGAEALGSDLGVEVGGADPAQGLVAVGGDAREGVGQGLAPALETSATASAAGAAPAGASSVVE